MLPPPSGLLRLPPFPSPTPTRPPTQHGCPPPHRPRSHPAPAQALATYPSYLQKSLGRIATRAAFLKARAAAPGLPL